MYCNFSNKELFSDVCQVESEELIEYKYKNKFGFIDSYQLCFNCCTRFRQSVPQIQTNKGAFEKDLIEYIKLNEGVCLKEMMVIFNIPQHIIYEKLKKLNEFIGVESSYNPYKKGQRIKNKYYYKSKAQV